MRTLLSGSGETALAEDQAIEGAAEAETAESGHTRRSKSRLILVLSGVALLLVVLAGAGAYMTGLLDSVLRRSADGASSNAGGSEHGTAPAAASVLFELPEFIVNLNVRSAKSRFLKVKTRLQLADSEAAHHVELALPRIVDAFQVYLRELRPEDLQGSAGTFRLREALLRRISAQIGEGRVLDVLFVEIFVQ